MCPKCNIALFDNATLKKNIFFNDFNKRGKMMKK